MGTCFVFTQPLSTLELQQLSPAAYPVGPCPSSQYLRHCTLSVFWSCLLCLYSPLTASLPASHCLPLCLSLFSCIKLPFRERSAKAQVLREIHLFLWLVLFIGLIKTHGSMTEQSCDWALPL